MNYLRVLSLSLLVTLVGCTTPADLMKRYPRERRPPELIRSDVQTYIQDNIPPEELSPTDTTYGLDTSGRRAVRILQLFPPRGSGGELYHVLYYDKDLKRTKVKTLRWTPSEGEPNLLEMLWYGIF